MNIQKILDEFDKKFEHKKIQFRIHTGGFVNSDYELVEAKETIRAFLKQSLEQAYRQGVESVVLPKRIIAIKGSCDIEEYEYANGRNDTIRTIEQLKANLLKE